MSAPEGAAPPSDAPPPAQGGNPGLDKAVAAIGGGLEKLVAALGQSGAPEEVTAKFAQALDTFAQAADSLTGGGEPEAAKPEGDRGMSTPEGGEPMTQQMRGM
jgi:hypothetical protein